MTENTNRVDEAHRKELLRFLLVKTAAVRRGVKPGELLRVRHCYEGVNAEGLRVCLYRSDIYGILGLDYVELTVEEKSSLVLFYNPHVLASTLAEPRNARWLTRMGYPPAASLHDLLAHLVRRAGRCDLPHEVGIFIGYPLKDVAELLILGSSTWGVGDLQDDWAAQLDAVKSNFAGKKVAVFGLGDSQGFADSFCVAAETIANAAKDAGATLVGDVLKLDDTNEADQTDGKIAAWVETLKAAL